MPVQEILSDLYKIEIPLPDNPLRALNSYVFKAGDRNLLVDTGFNRQECLQAMKLGLEEIGVDLEKTDIFITHMHADHCGLILSLTSSGAKAYCSYTDAEAINNTYVRSGKPRDKMLDFARLNGFPVEKHPGFNYTLDRPVSFTTLRDGDAVNVGDYHFQCVETPGHTRGHMCLYEPGKKILISGDHILSDITPTITQWSEQGNNLKEYINSLDKVSRLDVALVLPGHRQLITDYQGRIRKLRNHHQQRLQEVLSLLTKDGQTAYEVAARMGWNLACNSWELFPITMKWFATGEALSHLIYLEEEGKIQSIGGERRKYLLKDNYRTNYKIG